MVGVHPDRILAAARYILQKPAPKSQRPPIWDGKAASRIVGILREHLQHDRQLKRKQEFGLDLHYTFPLHYGSKKKLSVFMPVYNERATLRQVVDSVLSVLLKIELIYVEQVEQ